MAEATHFTRSRLIASLLRIQHADKDAKKDNVTKLSAYLAEGLAAAQADPELFAHLIAWNGKNGKVRDSKVAFPLIALRALRKSDTDLAENAVANLLMLSPRDLVRAYDFSKHLTSKGQPILGGHRRMLERGLRQYLTEREQRVNWWDRTALQHRDTLKRLYRLAHQRPSPRAQAILFERKYPPNSIFAKVRDLRHYPAKEAAGMILEYKIPFQVAVGAVNLKDKDVALALIEGMTGNQLITNTAMLTRMGVMADPVLLSAYTAAVDRSKKDTRTESLKAGHAATHVKDESAKAKLSSIQKAGTERLGSIEGDWLVLGDRSGSMAQAIEAARQVAALIANRVSGKVHLVFFNVAPTPFDVSGKSYAKIAEETKRVGANGGTSIGCGLDLLLSMGEIVNAIAIVSDGGENQAPLFPVVYRKYCTALSVEPTVYLFHVPGDPNVLTPRCRDAGIQVEEFELRGEVDFYSLPNIVKTLRAGRYALFEEIMATPLLTFADIFKEEIGHAHQD